MNAKRLVLLITVLFSVSCSTKMDFNCTVSCSKCENLKLECDRKARGIVDDITEEKPT